MQSTGGAAASSASKPPRPAVEVLPKDTSAKEKKFTGPIASNQQAKTLTTQAPTKLLQQNLTTAKTKVTAKLLQQNLETTKTTKPAATKNKPMMKIKGASSDNDDDESQVCKTNQERIFRRFQPCL